MERKIDTCHNFDIEIGCTQTYCSCEDEEPLKFWESDIANGLNSFIDTQIGNKPIKQREPKQEKYVTIKARVGSIVIVPKEIEAFKKHGIDLFVALKTIQREIYK